MVKITLLKKLLLFSAALIILPVSAENKDNKQCELISQLTGDYYQHKQNGLSKQQVNQQFRPDFANADFLRIIDLSINMAFSFNGEQTVETVIEKVYQQCLTYQQ